MNTSTPSSIQEPSFAKDRGSVTVRSLSKVFGSGSHAFKALDDVSVDIRKNEFFTLLGPSGCGKTTLLRLIAGFEQPTSGEVLLDGEDLSARPPYQRPVNTVFQNYALFPHMTVAENISFGLEMLGRPKDQIKSVTADMLRLVQLEAMADRRITQISGGQQQRVALARALAPQPKVLLLDEPLSALDLQLRKEMQIELKRLQTETGITFVFVTHDQDEALTMSDRIAVMNGGEILQIGTPREIYDKAAAPLSSSGFIGEINLGARSRRWAHMTMPLRGRGCCPSDDGRRRCKGEPSRAWRPPPERIALSAPEAVKLPGVVAMWFYHGTTRSFHIGLVTGGTIRALFPRNQTRRRYSSLRTRATRSAGSVDAASVSVLADDPSMTRAGK